MSDRSTVGETALHLCMGCNEDLPPGSIASRKWCDECVQARRNKRKTEREREVRAQLGVGHREYRALLRERFRCGRCRRHVKREDAVTVTSATGAPTQVCERCSKSKAPCRVCAGLGERRPRVGTCRGCGRPWAAEPRASIEDFISSGAGALGRLTERRAGSGATRETKQWEA